MPTILPPPSSAALLLTACTLSLCVLSGCATTPEASRSAVDGAAASVGMEPRLYAEAPFTLAGWLRAGSGGPLVVYIEGDGRAWLSPTQPSHDPTPYNPVALELARRDPSSRVLYLGRPCQYGGVATDPACTVPAWTSRRFAPEVIGALGRALDQAKRDCGAKRLLLIGYSGGGVAAALLADRRTDVAGLVTLAAPLDLAAWTALQRLTPLTGSLDPAAEAERLAAVPQWHIAGGADHVVPPTVVHSFAVRLGRPPGREPMRVVPGMAHDGDWPSLWPALRADLPAMP